MKTEIIALTPEMAARYLQNNHKNRKLNMTVVRYYADQMKRGQWKLTGQGISISKEGEPLDGNHRLHACVMSGVTVPILLITGVDSDTFDVYDTGKLRNAADSLSIIGAPNSVSIAVMINKYFRLRDDKLMSNKTGVKWTKYTNTDVIKFYEKRSGALQNLHAYATRIYTKNRLLKKHEIGAIYLYLILHKKHPQERIESFFEQLAGYEPMSNTTIDRLRDILIKNTYSIKKLDPARRLAYVIKAWNYYLIGKNVQNLIFLSNEKYPKLM